MEYNNFNPKKDYNKMASNRFMERSLMFNMDTKNLNREERMMNPEYNGNDRRRRGEITGENLDFDESNKGMPIRGQYNGRRLNEADESQNIEINRLFDTEIYDDDTSIDMNVQYHDPNGQGYSSAILERTNEIRGMGFADIDDSINPLQSKIMDPVNLLSDTINDYTFFLFNNLNQIMTKNYAITPLGLVSFFSTLYASSTGTSQRELKTYFGLPEKSIISNGLNLITNTIKKSKLTDIVNILLIDRDIPINPSYYNHIKEQINLIRVNRTNLKLFPISMNNMGDNLEEIVSSISNTVLQNVEVANIYNVTIRTYWTYRPNIINGLFEKRREQYMSFVNNVFKYFEDALNQFVEVVMSDSITSFGMIIPKNGMNIIDNKMIERYIKNAKDSILDEVQIPIFTQRTKLRMNNILRNTGLEYVFSNLESPELIKQTTSITDIVHQVNIIVDPHVGDIMRPKGAQTRRKVIANKPFVYYFRNIQTKAIISIGLYR